MSKDNKESRREAKANKAAEKRDYRIEKIKAATAQALATAKKRKYLVLLIVAAIAAYLVIFKGGSGSGMLDTVKNLF